MQLIAKHRGGSVERADRREYGPATIEIHEDRQLFEGMDRLNRVWMSHGDHVEATPDGWSVLASTDNCPVAAMVSADGRTFGIQFHPEVTHSVQSVRLIRNFLFAIWRVRTGRWAVSWRSRSHSSGTRWGMTTSSVHCPVG